MTEKTFGESLYRYGGYNLIVKWVRYLAIVALAIWIGGWIALGGVAAPTLFSTLGAHDPLQGRATAGVAFGAIFHRFQQISWGLAGVVLISLFTRAALGPRPRRLAVRVWTVVSMVLVSVGAEVLAARKDQFPHWHALSTALVGIIIVAGLGLLWAETHD